MSMAFYYFKNDEWDRPIPSCRPLNNSNEMRMMSYYLSELDIEFSENILAVSYTHLTLPTTPYV